MAMGLDPYNIPNLPPDENMRPKAELWNDQVYIDEHETR